MVGAEGGLHDGREQHEGAFLVRFDSPLAQPCLVGVSDVCFLGVLKSNFLFAAQAGTTNETCARELCVSAGSFHPCSARPSLFCSFLVLPLTSVACSVILLFLFVVCSLTLCLVAVSLLRNRTGTRRAGIRKRMHLEGRMICRTATANKSFFFFFCRHSPGRHGHSCPRR